MTAQPRLYAAVAAFWMLCAVVSAAAFWTMLQLGTVRMANPSSATMWQIVRLQAPPWIAVTLLTPLVIHWAKRLGRFIAVLRVPLEAV